MALRLDVRDLLASVKCPVLVLGSRRSMASAPLPHLRYLVDHLPDARMELYESVDHLAYQPEHQAWFNDQVEEFFTGSRPIGDVEDRVLSTILFTDVVSSTETAVRLGDHEWRRLLDAIEREAAALVARHKGVLVKTTGDGILATFDGPTRAVRCALSLRDVGRRHGLDLRAGVHTGEVELRGDDVGGVAVHIAARVMSLAQASEVPASSTVKDLTIGAGLTFEDRGEHPLKGVPDAWHVYAVRD